MFGGFSGFKKILDTIDTTCVNHYCMFLLVNRVESIKSEVVSTKDQMLKVPQFVPGLAFATKFVK